LGREIFALWVGVAAFGFTLGLPEVILADAIGYVLTRRGAPFGGAGFLDVTLAMCLWACGVPLAPAIAGTLVYRFFSLFAPMPFCVAALPTLRDIGGEQDAPSSEPAVQPHGTLGRRRFRSRLDRTGQDQRSFRHPTCAIRCWSSWEAVAARHVSGNASTPDKISRRNAPDARHATGCAGTMTAGGVLTGYGAVIRRGQWPRRGAGPRRRPRDPRS
jgi:hypothetical protein